MIVRVKKMTKYNLLVFLSLGMFSLFNFFNTGKNTRNLCEIIIMAVIIFFFRFYKEKKVTITKKHKNIVHVLYLLFAFVILFKLFFSIKMKYTTGNYSSFFEFRIIERSILYLTAALYEECVFKGIIYEQLKLYNKKSISFLFTVLIFFILHDSFTIYSLIGLSLYQIYTLIIYEMEPDILKLSLFHFLSNMAILI